MTTLWQRTSIQTLNLIPPVQRTTGTTRGGIACCNAEDKLLVGEGT